MVDYNKIVAVFKMFDSFILIQYNIISSMILLAILRLVTGHFQLCSLLLSQVQLAMPVLRSQAIDCAK